VVRQDQCVNLPKVLRCLAFLIFTDLLRQGKHNSDTGLLSTKCIYDHHPTAHFSESLLNDVDGSKKYSYSMPEMNLLKKRKGRKRSVRSKAWPI